jgi:K+-sensing histidine kinase KdpD
MNRPGALRIYLGAGTDVVVGFVPDAVARRADQIGLVDMSPEALRRRMVHGNIYPTDRIDAALTHYFRPWNLNALRQLAHVQLRPVELDDVLDAALDDPGPGGRRLDVDLPEIDLPAAHESAGR